MAGIGTAAENLSYVRGATGASLNELTFPRCWWRPALYMIPGMGHCGGGVSVSCNQIDWVTPLVNWVEKRIPPNTLQGATADGSRTRPVCRYPAFEKYKGQGDINDAKNFVCVAE
jgi:Tannase and feruloyl esterase